MLDHLRYDAGGDMHQVIGIGIRVQREGGAVHDVGDQLHQGLGAGVVGLGQVVGRQGPTAQGRQCGVEFLHLVVASDGRAMLRHGLARGRQQRVDFGRAPLR
jgi:hypothetical protein